MVSRDFDPLTFFEQLADAKRWFERSIRPNAQQDYRVGFVGLGKIARAGIEAMLRELNGPEALTQIEEVRVFGREEGLERYKSYLRGLPKKVARGCEPGKAEAYSAQTSLRELSADLDLLVFTHDVGAARYGSWCKDHGVKVNRDILGFQNAPLTAKLAEHVPEGFPGSLLVVSNDTEMLAGVMAAKLDDRVDPRRIVGVTHVDQRRLESDLRATEKSRRGQHANEQGSVPGQGFLKIEDAFAIGRHSNPWAAISQLRIDGVPKGYEYREDEDFRMSEALDQYAQQQVSYGHGTASETGLAITRTIKAAFDDAPESWAVGSIPTLIDGDWVYASQPFYFSNFHGVARDDGQWIKSLPAHDKEAFLARARSVRESMELVSGELSRQALEDRIAHLLRESDPLPQQGEFEELTPSAAKSMAQEVVNNYLEMGGETAARFLVRATPVPRKPQQKSHQVRVSPTERPPEYDHLRLNGRLLARGGDGVVVYDLHGFQPLLETRLGKGSVVGAEMRDDALYLLEKDLRATSFSTLRRAGNGLPEKSVGLPNREARGLALLEDRVYVLHGNNGDCAVSVYDGDLENITTINLQAPYALSDDRGLGVLGDDTFLLATRGGVAQVDAQGNETTFLEAPPEAMLGAVQTDGRFVFASDAYRIYRWPVSGGEALSLDAVMGVYGRRDDAVAYMEPQERLLTVRSQLGTKRYEARSSNPKGVFFSGDNALIAGPDEWLVQPLDDGKLPVPLRMGVPIDWVYGVVE